MDGKARGRLLLVEDETILRRLIAEFLRAEGYEVLEAADGPEGVSVYSSQGPFDVVLLDLNLPLLSGVDVCRRIKALHPHQPVLICSAAILDRHIEELRSLRVEQFLTKPYHPLDLLARIADEMARGAGPRGPRPAAIAPRRPRAAGGSPDRGRCTPTLFNPPRPG